MNTFQVVLVRAYKSQDSDEEDDDDEVDQRRSRLATAALAVLRVILLFKLSKIMLCVELASSRYHVWASLNCCRSKTDVSEP